MQVAVPSSHSLADTLRVPVRKCGSPALGYSAAFFRLRGHATFRHLSRGCLRMPANSKTGLACLENQSIFWTTNLRHAHHLVCHTVCFLRFEIGRAHV